MLSSTPAKAQRIRSTLKIFTKKFVDKVRRNRIFVDHWSIILISKSVPQPVSGPVRANMFKAIDHMDGGHSRERLAGRFVQAVRGDWDKILSGVFGCQSVNSISEEHMKTLKQIYLRAYDWNHKVKACLVTLDYIIYMPPHNAPFDSTNMHCLAKGERKPSSIICAAWFGLWSSRAVGKQQEPEIVCQQKSEILSEQFFRNV